MQRLRALIIVAVLAGTAVGQLATWTPTDMKSVPFAFDPNQLSDPNGANLAGFVTLDTGATWSRDWYVWCDRDIAFTYTVSHGTHTRTATAVDPNGEKRATYRITYTVPSTPGVIYFKATFALPAWPGISVPRDYLINVVQPPPKIQHWTVIPYWLPHGPAYIAGRSDAGKIWQESMKLAGVTTERDKNDKLFLAWMQGKVVMP